MILNMMQIIENPKRDPRFTGFNLKIEAYNHAMENGNQAGARQLLQEIHYFQQELTNLALDSLFDPRSVRGDLKAIFDWNGVAEELPHWTDPKKIPVSPLSTEQLLNTLTGIPDAPAVIEQWRSESDPTLVGSVFNAVSFLWGYTRNPQIDQNIKELLVLHDTHGFASLNYFYGLQKVKQQILHTINFIILSAADLTQYQTLLNQINGQINEVIRSIPVLASRYASHDAIALPLRQDFQIASQEKKEDISRVFLSADFNQSMDISSEPDMSEEDIADYNETMAKNKASIHQALPSLDNLYVRKISSANNKTWLIQQDELGEQTVLRVEQPSPASLIQGLRATPVNEFLAQTYATCLHEYNPYPIVISEFSPNGDLRSNRIELQETQKNEDVLQHAIADIGQMAQFCKVMLEQQAMHSDLKLSNFLLRSPNTIFINDMKAFKTINTEGNILARDTIVTPPFAPPEYKKSELSRHMVDGKQIELNADKFMSYQLGLALYDHLVLPTNADWSEKALDFNHPVFTSPTGKKLQTLIKLLTLEYPKNRMGVQDALNQLEKLQSQSAKLYMALQVSDQPPSTGILEPTHLEQVEEVGHKTVHDRNNTHANDPTNTDSHDEDSVNQHPKI